MKECSYCHIIKDVTEFYGNKNECKSCKKSKVIENKNSKKSALNITPDCPSTNENTASEENINNTETRKILPNNFPSLTEMYNMSTKNNTTTKVKNLNPINLKTYDDESDGGVSVKSFDGDKKQFNTKDKPNIDRISIKKLILDSIRNEKMHFNDEFISINKDANIIIDENSTLPSKFFNLERKINNNYFVIKNWVDTIYSSCIPSIYNKINDVYDIIDSKLKDFKDEIVKMTSSENDTLKQEIKDVILINNKLREEINGIRKEFDNKIEDTDNKNMKRILEYQVKLIETNDKHENKISDLNNIIRERDEEIKLLKSKLHLTKLNTYV
jgi:hypothetical protein